VGEVHAGADADVDGAAGEDEGALVRRRGDVQVHVLEAHLPRVLEVAAHYRCQNLLSLVTLPRRPPVSERAAKRAESKPPSSHVYSGWMDEDDSDTSEHERVCKLERSIHRKETKKGRADLLRAVERGAVDALDVGPAGVGRQALVPVLVHVHSEKRHLRHAHLAVSDPLQP
jgi:hypothetical protein